MSLHREAVLGDRHAPANWEYADATARGAATGFISADVGKLARQLSDNSLWMLTATTPTWVAISGTGATGAPGATGPAGTASVTTKGDLQTFSTVAARLGVGSNGQSLFADSTQTTGLIWRVIAAADVPSLPASQITSGTFADARLATYNNAGNSSTALTVDWSAGRVQKVTLTGNCTFTFSNPVAGQVYVLQLVQDGTGSRTVTWPASVKWSGGTAPTLTTTASKTDVITFLHDGTSYLGVTSGLNY